jgi:hypothetical protein
MRGMRSWIRATTSFGAAVRTEIPSSRAIAAIANGRPSSRWK